MTTTTNATQIPIPSAGVSPSLVDSSVYRRLPVKVARVLASRVECWLADGYITSVQDDTTRPGASLVLHTAEPVLASDVGAGASREEITSAVATNMIVMAIGAVERMFDGELELIVEREPRALRITL